MGAMRRSWALGCGLALSALTFVVDLAIPTGYAVGVAHVVAVCAALLSGVPRDTLWLASTATLFTLLDIALGAQAASLPVTLTNRALTLMVIWSVAAVVALANRSRLRATQVRQKAEQLLHSMVEAAPDGMLVVDRRGFVRFANTTVGRLFGWRPEELMGQPVERLVPAARAARHLGHRARYEEAKVARPMGHKDGMLGERKDGTQFPIDVALSPLELPDGEALVVASVRDVTDRQKLDQRLRSTQRLEAIGRLAGGVAHDFNNLLAVIKGYGTFMRDQLPGSGSAAADLEEILAAADRAAALTAQLVAFSRRQVIEPRPLSVNAVLSDLERMLRRILGEDVELAVRPQEHVWTVEVDPSQLEQILMNLTVNARDAMPQGGKLTLEVSNVTLDASYAESHEEVEAGEYVMLAVSDSGEGMSEAVRARIFEPFFTTKEVGRGSGLGLATVYGIVKQARGHIWVYSEPGKGTTFKLYLPRSLQDPKPPRARSQAPRATGGAETLLVVEDDPALRRTLLRTLQSAGYRVLEAGNGAQALLEAEAAGEDLRLVITDVVMPQMGGRELAQRLLEERSALRVLFLSGYTENAIVHHGVLDAGLAFLQKPFSPDELKRKVREQLDRR